MIKNDAEQPNKTEPVYIDVTPTWGEIGNIYASFAHSGEIAALKPLHPELARAMAMAQALREILDGLTDEQHKTVSDTIKKELAKQGF